MVLDFLDLDVTTMSNRMLAADESHEYGNMVIFTGGTAFNEAAACMKNVWKHVSYILPVSDDGGSSAEICRVLGGPALGDVRSRCLRLSDTSTRESRAVQSLLGHRLSNHNELEAKTEWLLIVEGSHSLWNDIQEAYKHMIRSFLVYFQSETLKVIKNEIPFRFQNGSIGNFFFAGARLFFRSIEAAIFLYNRVSGVPNEIKILPVIVDETRLAIGCELQNRLIIKGQSNISHPSADGKSNNGNKLDQEPLPSPIKRIMYLGTEGKDIGSEISPHINPLCLEQIKSARIIVYGMGSLYTSLISSLIVDGISEAILTCINVPKVLILNGDPDRETNDMKASDYVMAIKRAMNQHDEIISEAKHCVSHIFYSDKTNVEVDCERLKQLGISYNEIESTIVDTPAGKKVHVCVESLCRYLLEFIDSPQEVLE